MVAKEKADAATPAPVDSGLKTRTRLEVLKDLASICQSVLVICSILAAGIWFFVHREAWPKANISHELNHLQLSPEWTWLRVAVRLENVSKRLLEIDSGTIRVQQVLPLDSQIAQSLAKGENPVSAEELIVPWPRLGDSYQLQTHCEIEPGETDILEYEFIIPAHIQVVKIYTYFANGRSVPLGWSKGSIYCLSPPQEQAPRGEMHSRPEKGVQPPGLLAQVAEPKPQPQEPPLRRPQPKADDSSRQPEPDRQMREQMDRKWDEVIPRQVLRPEPLPSTERTLPQKN